MATMSDYRQMLLEHLETYDPLTLMKLRQTGELEDFPGIQLDAVQNLRASNPPRKSEKPSQKAVRTEIEVATLLEYQMPTPR